MSYIVKMYAEYKNVMDIFGWLFGAASDGHTISYNLSLHNSYTYDFNHTWSDATASDVTDGGKSLPAVLNTFDYMSAVTKTPHILTHDGENIVWQWENASFTYDTAICRIICPSLPAINGKLLFAYIRDTNLPLSNQTVTIKPYMLDVAGFGIFACVEDVIVSTPPTGYTMETAFFERANPNQSYGSYGLWVQFSTGRLINPVSFSSYYYSRLYNSATTVSTIQLTGLNSLITEDYVGITADAVLHPAIITTIDRCSIGVYWSGYSTYHDKITRTFTPILDPQGKAVRITFPDGYIFKWQFEPAVEII